MQCKWRCDWNFLGESNKPILDERVVVSKTHGLYNFADELTFRILKFIQNILFYAGFAHITIIQKIYFNPHEIWCILEYISFTIMKTKIYPYYAMLLVRVYKLFLFKKLELAQKPELFKKTFVYPRK